LAKLIPRWLFLKEKFLKLDSKAGKNLRHCEANLNAIKFCIQNALTK